MVQFEEIVLESDRTTGVTTLTLNRPEKRNAMSPSLHLEMAAALEELRYDPDTRVLVLTGAGESFCAGMDLKEFFYELKEKPEEYDRIYRIATEWRGRTLPLFPKPTVAAVNGWCFGGAFSIVEGCDLAVAADSAVFGLSEVNFGMFPGGSVSNSLSNLLRPRDALYYALTGETFGGMRAAEIGLVNYAVAAAELQSNVKALAESLAQKDSEALAATKEAYRVSRSLDGDWDSAIAYSRAREKALTLVQKDAWKSEGIGNFIAKEYRPGLGARRP